MALHHSSVIVKCTNDNILVQPKQGHCVITINNKTSFYQTYNQIVVISNMCWGIMQFEQQIKQTSTSIHTVKNHASCTAEYSNNNDRNIEKIDFVIRSISI